jgi:hypothetical protein
VSTSTSRRRRVKADRPCRVHLTDTPKPVRLDQARKLVRQAAYVAVHVPLCGGRCHLFDVGRRTALRLLSRIASRHDRVPLSEVFGSLILGGLA